MKDGEKEEKKDSEGEKESGKTEDPEVNNLIYIGQ